MLPGSVRRFYERCLRLQHAVDMATNKLDLAKDEFHSWHLEANNINGLQGSCHFLDVGGQPFHVSAESVLSGRSKLLAALTSDDFACEMNDDGYIFLDRDPKWFTAVLAYVRTGATTLCVDQRNKQAIHREAVYYQVDALQLGGGMSQKNSLHQRKTAIENFGGQLLHELRGHGDDILAMALSSDKKVLASASEDRTLLVWDLRSGQLLFTALHDAIVNEVAISLDDDLVACGCEDGRIQLWSLNTHQRLQTLQGSTGSVKSLAFSQDLLASGGFADFIYLWDFRQGTLRQTLSAGSSAYALAFSADFRLLASALEMNVVVWDVPKGAALLTLKGHSDRITTVAISSDGKLIASGSGDGAVRIWALDGRCLRTTSNHHYTPERLYFSNDSEWLFCGECFDNCTIWEVATGQKLKTVTSDWASSYVVSPDFEVLAIATDDDTIQVYGPLGNAA